MGSPPHTRGKDFFVGLVKWIPRITPAHAGKSVRRIDCRKIYRDHPRTRGEKGMLNRKSSSPQGSPPHTRGKADSSAFSEYSSRITPAHAGKSRFTARISTITEDQPRTRGEKQYNAHGQYRFRGSPPHTRGKDAYGGKKENKARITPAHAGKSFVTF